MYMKLKKVISDVKKQYALLPYNLHNIDLIDNDIFQSCINPQLFFEVLLLEIRNKTISFSVAMKKKEKSLLEQLETDIKNLEQSDAVKNFDNIKTKHDEL